jgi:hypothetical protein
LDFKRPAGWLHLGARAALWAGDVWVCSQCKRYWYLVYHPKDMYYQEVVLFPEALEPLVKIATPWREAWALRDVAHTLTAPFLTRYLKQARLPWGEAAPGIVADLVISENRHALQYLEAVFANYGAMRTAGVTRDEAALTWAACAPLQPPAGAADADQRAWDALRERAETNIAKLQLVAREAKAQAVKAAAAAAAPRITVPYSPFYTERIPGPEPLESTIAYSPGTREVVRQAWANIARDPFGFLGPALFCLIAIDACGPNLPGGDELSLVTLLPMCLLAYAAAASVTAGRWNQPVWRLTVDRFGEIFAIWGVLLLTIPAWFAAAFVFDTVMPGTPATPLNGRWLAFAAVALPGLRFWPVVTAPFVYRGYKYYESVDTSGVNTVWIGPGLRTVWRITGQPGFFTQITLPLLGAVAVVLGVMELAGWRWWARWAFYFAALPLLMQYADEAVDRWRVLTGKAGIDR